MNPQTSVGRYCGNGSEVRFPVAVKRLAAVLASFFIATEGLTFAQDQIPEMTSDSTPSGFASASSSVPGYEAWKAFDDTTDNESQWHNFVGQTGWLAYEFVSPKIITGYSIEPNHYNHVSYAPRDWSFEGWNGTSWNTLDVRVGVEGWAYYEKKTFQFTNTNSYIRYRINVSANGGANNLSIGELEMFGSNIAAGTLTVLADTAVLSGFTSTDGNSPFLATGGFNDFGDQYAMRTYLKFALPALSPGTMITSATLSGYYLNSANPRIDDTFCFYRASSNVWEEATLHWYNQPGTTGDALVSFSSSGLANNTRYSWDITPALHTLYASSNDGVISLVLRADNEILGSNSSVKQFASKEHSSNEPFRIQYTIGPDPSWPQTVHLERIHGIGNVVSFIGLPNTIYRIQRSTNLIAWGNLEDVESDGEGDLAYTDSAPPTGNVFYRLQRLP